MRTVALPLLLTALLVATTGCLTAMGPQPPDDPASFDYIYRAGGAHKAPHPTALDGAYARLEVRLGGATFTAETTRLRVTAIVAAPEGPGGAPVLGPPAITLGGVNGRFVHDGGDVTPLENATVRVAARGGFNLTGLASVTLTEGAFQGGRVTFTGGPDVVATPGAPTVAVAANGARATGVRIHEDPGPFTGHYDEESALGPGTLELDEGAYDLRGFLTAEATAPVTAPVPIDAPTAHLHIKGARGLTLRGEARSPDAVRVHARDITGTVDAPGGRASLEMGAVQWWTDHRPRFEARLEAAFHDPGAAEADMTLRRGENATVWVRVAETSRVGTAPNVHPRLDAGALNATWGADWYATANPSAWAQAGNAFKNAFFGLFIDFSVRDFDPGETAYIPLWVEAPGDAATGDHTVTGHFNGDNAKTNTVTLRVRVTE